MRSQDKKKLIKVNEIKIESVREGNSFIYSDITDLGSYESKERALEILDEIQNIIKPTFLNTKYNCEIKDGHNKNEFDLVMQPDESKIQIIQPTTIIYEMPKE